LGALLFAAACGGGSSNNTENTSAKNPGIQANSAPTSTPPPEVTIQIADNTFTPAELTVKAGTTVRWVWGGSNQHSVLISGTDSGKKTGTGTFEQTFKDGGQTLSYACGVYPTMTGKITVE
jgi:plastocyanin